MAKTTIDFLIVFKECETDLSQCSNCDDIIYGNMHQLKLQADAWPKSFIYDTDVQLCASCRDLIHDIPQI